MQINLPHAIASAILFGTMIYLIQSFGFMGKAPRFKRALVIGIVVFLVIFVFNLIWPSWQAPGL